MNSPSDTTGAATIQQHQDLLATHRERLALLLAQQAHFGAYVPPHIVIEIRATQEALRPIKAWLRSQGLVVADEPNDDMHIAAEATTPHLSSDKVTQTINNQAPNQGAQGTFYGPVTFGGTGHDDE